MSRTRGGCIPSLDQTPKELKESVPAGLAHDIIRFASTHDDDSPVDDLPASITPGHSITPTVRQHFAAFQTDQDIRLDALLAQLHDEGELIIVVPIFFLLFRLIEFNEVIVPILQSEPIRYIILCHV